MIVGRVASLFLLLCGLMWASPQAAADDQRPHIPRPAITELISPTFSIKGISPAGVKFLQSREADLEFTHTVSIALKNATLQYENPEKTAAVKGSIRSGQIAATIVIAKSTSAVTVSVKPNGLNAEIDTEQLATRLQQGEVSAPPKRARVTNRVALTLRADAADGAVQFRLGPFRVSSPKFAIGNFQFAPAGDIDIADASVLTAPLAAAQPVEFAGTYVVGAQPKAGPTEFSFGGLIARDASIELGASRIHVDRQSTTAQFSQVTVVNGRMTAPDGRFEFSLGAEPASAIIKRVHLKSDAGGLSGTFDPFSTATQSISAQILQNVTPLPLSGTLQVEQRQPNEVSIRLATETMPLAVLKPDQPPIAYGVTMLLKFVPGITIVDGRAALKDFSIGALQMDRGTLRLTHVPGGKDIRLQIEGQKERKSESRPAETSKGAAGNTADVTPPAAQASTLRLDLIGSRVGEVWQVNMPARGVVVDASGAPASLPVSNGLYERQSRRSTLRFSNTAPIEIRNGAWSGSLMAVDEAGQLSNLSVGLTVEDEERKLPIPKVRTSSPKFSLAIDLQDGEFSVSGTIELPDIVLELPAEVYYPVPIGGGGLVELNGIRIKLLKITASLKELQLELLQTVVKGRRFSSTKPKYSGKMSTPLSIDYASQKAALKHKFKLAGFRIEKARLALEEALYDEPTLTARVKALSLEIKEAENDKASTFFSLKGLALKGSGDKGLEFQAGVVSVDLSLDLQRNGDDLNGGGRVQMPAAVAKVHLNIEPSKRCEDGPKYMPVTFGGLLASTTGMIIVEHGDHKIMLETDAALAGEAGFYKCDYKIPYRFEAPRVSYSYPCGISWRGIKWCRGWTCVPFCFDLRGTIPAELRVQEFKVLTAGADIELKIEGEDVKVCGFRPKLLATSIILLNFSPRIDAGGDLAKFVNELLAISFGFVESAIVNGVVVAGSGLFDAIGLLNLKIRLKC